jgi:hypothetical protein
VVRTCFSRRLPFAFARLGAGLGDGSGGGGGSHERGELISGNLRYGGRGRHASRLSRGGVVRVHGCRGRVTVPSVRVGILAGSRRGAVIMVVEVFIILVTILGRSGRRSASAGVTSDCHLNMKWGIQRRVG